MGRIKKWVLVTRLETSALAICSVMIGSGLAFFAGEFQSQVAVLSLLTAVLLQLLCNVANDYGDWVLGADAINTVKQPSAIQTKLVTLEEARSALWYLAGAAMLSGVSLLYVAQLPLAVLGFFALLGGLAVVAAITYTMGNNPYGYSGLGDLSVFVFFGIVGVGGTFYLHTQALNSLWVLPAISHGSLVVSILNINNLRDLDMDARVNKNTLAVRLGRKHAVRYHWLLLAVSVIAMVLFGKVYLSHPALLGLIMLQICLFIQQGIAVSHATPKELNKHLGTMVAIIVLLSSALVGVICFALSSHP